MKKGLIIGKFMPPHAGHLALVEFGAKNCDKLTVLVCSRPDNPVPGKLRYEWMKKIFRGRKNIHITWVRADLPQDSAPSRHASRVWSKYILKRFGKFDYIFSSEPYGDFVAEYLGAEHVPFDMGRGQFPVSGTKVRGNPHRYWNFIPEAVRPYYIKKVVFLGAESSGKTTIARELAKELGTEWMPEYGREYWAKHHAADWTLTPEQLVEIARGHLRRENGTIKKCNKYFFVDTNAITTEMFARFYHNDAHPELVRLAKVAETRYDHCFVCDIDIPYEDDGQRNGAEHRIKFQRQILEDLDRRGVKYELLSGNLRERIRKVKQRLTI